MIQPLPPIDIEGHQPSGIGTPDHPMRSMTRRIAGLDPGGWDREAAHLVTSVFDSLAPEWHTRSSAQRTAVVVDAITRGLEPLVTSNELCVEVGSGVGAYSPLLAERFRAVLSAELSWEMLVRAGSETLRVRADGGALPVADSTVNAIVLINAFLFPEETDRVLTPDGVVLWVNSSGEQTPIHLTTEEVVAALPFAVEGAESRAGAGTWCALRRA